MSELSPYQQSVVKERAALEVMVTKLAEFISASVVFRMLPTADQVLLRQQFKAMDDYREILIERIERFTS